MNTSHFTRARLMSVKSRGLLFILIAFAVAGSAVLFLNTRAADPPQKVALCPDCPPDLAAFSESVDGKFTPVVVELRGDPGFIRKVAAEAMHKPLAVEQLGTYALALRDTQNDFYESLSSKGVRALMRTNDVEQLDGSIRHIEYRFTYLLNGFVAYVADEDIERLRALPEVTAVSVLEPEQYHLDRAIDYSLGTQPNPEDRRQAVYGSTREFTPETSDPTHPETPRLVAADGFEGQDMNIAVIDSGVDYRHQMFGGTGNNTPFPRISGQPAAAADNRKVIYFYTMSRATGDPTDDFGHGTLVASNAGGYMVNGSTPRATGFGTGVSNPDGTPGTGIGPTPGGRTFFGTAPQAKIMVYKVCGPGPNCAGDTPLSIEDAASPVTLLTTNNAGVIASPKPVADVINLSLGSEGGDSASATSRACNNAALAGTIVVASAGNSGPGAGTIGAPAAATLAIAVAASLDPGSVAGADVLRADQVPLRAGDTSTTPPTVARGDTCSQSTRTEPCDTMTPPTAEDEEQGSSSNANALETGSRARAGIRIFPVAGGGALPIETTPGEPTFVNDGSLSAHYTFLNRGDGTSGVPTAFANSIRNRIVIVKFSGTFAAAANSIAPFNPAAIVLLTSFESATAVQVLNGTPTFTMSVADGEFLLDALSSSTADDGATADPVQGAISELPLRLAESISLPAFQGAMASFSSRGPLGSATGRFRHIKPDVTAPGVGIQGAATPEGIPDDAVGLASLTGYTVANGTSFSGPITAGAMALLRQRVRSELLTDNTDPSSPTYNADRRRTVTIARALLQNSATNLRDGLGNPQPDGSGTMPTQGTAAINEQGAGHINIARALTARAIMVSPTLLLADANPDSTGSQREFTRPSSIPASELDANGNLPVEIPTASFGLVPVIGYNNVIVRQREVRIRDVFPGAGGGGTYNLSIQDNRNTTDDGFVIRIVNAAGENITSVTVPEGGEASYFVRVEADGTKLTTPDRDYQWYVTATNAPQFRPLSKRAVTRGAPEQSDILRMPVFYRTALAPLNDVNAPSQQPVQGTEGGASGTTAGTECVTDANGSYTLNYTYTPPAARPSPAPTPPAPVGFRIQEATNITSIFADDASEPLINGANSRFAGSAQWTTQTDPNTGSAAYFIPDAAEQNESLTSVPTRTGEDNQPPPPIVLPAGSSASLSFTTTQDLEPGFDFGIVEVSRDNGTTFQQLASFTGAFVGQRNLDLSQFAGNTIRLRFRLTSDLANDVVVVGWYVDNILISSDNFTTLGDVPATQLTFPIANRPNATYLYRIAAIFNGLEGTITGPFSNLRCVTVNAMPTAETATVGGAITDVRGRPISGVRVTLDGSLTRTTLTDRRGVFTFTNLPEGEAFVLRAAKPGFTFSPATRTVTTEGSVQQGTADFNGQPKRRRTFGTRAAEK